MFKNGFGVCPMVTTLKNYGDSRWGNNTEIVIGVFYLLVLEIEYKEDDWVVRSMVCIPRHGVFRHEN